MIKFWKKKKILVLSVEKTFDEVCDGLTEEDIVKLENVSSPGTRLMCIGNYNPTYSNYNNVRDYLQYRKDYLFKIGRVYIVAYINNDIIYVEEEVIQNKSQRINNYPFYLIKHSSKNPHLFDYFMLESDYIIMERDKIIEKLID
jgi:hypothetical protein